MHPNVWRCCAIMLVAAGALLSPAWSQEEAVDLQLALPAGWETTYRFEADLTTASMSGQPVPVAGSVEADVNVEVTQVDEATGVMTLQIGFSNVTASLQGQPMKQPDLGPTTLQVSPYGELTTGQTEGNVDLFATGMLPLHILATPLLITRFKGEPVAVGDEWTFEEEAEVPGLGKVASTSSYVLDGVDDDAVTVTSSLEATIPEFTTSVPFMPGEFRITGGTLKLVKLKRILSPSERALREASGTVAVEVSIDMGGTVVPVALEVEVALSAAEDTGKPEEPPQPEEAEQPGARDEAED